MNIQYYGLFIYDKESDTIQEEYVNKDLELLVIKYNNFIKENDNSLYAELWKADHNNLFGVCGEPLLKSDILRYNFSNEFL